jgi:hypothetical protein
LFRTSIAQIKKVVDFLIKTQRKTGDFPARKDAHEFIRPLKAKLSNKKNKN